MRAGLVLSSLLLVSQAAQSQQLPAQPVPAASPAPVAQSADHPVLTSYYNQAANAAAQVDGAVAEARSGGRLAVLVFGADWCGDSVALAAVLDSDLFRAHLGERYSVTFIDVNRPTRGEGRNLDVLAQFGFEPMTGTPEVLVIGRDGKPINSNADAHSWRDAGDRPVRDIMRYFRDLPAPRDGAATTPAPKA